MSIYYILPKSSIHFICLFFSALLLNCLIILELFRAHTIAKRNLKIVLGIFISKWMVTSTVKELSISVHKYPAIETNENVDTKYPN